MANIEIRDLKLNFGAVQVFEQLNLDIHEGEFIVLLGPSGCGKSTLLNCIAGLLDITDGQIFIGGKNVTWEEPKDRGIGMVFQSYALYPQMTVRGNLSFGLKNQRMSKSEIDERVARAAEVLQIEPLLDRKPAALSGGQRQRVAIGRALVRDVDVFLFDEPLSNLDAKLRSELRVEIKRLHAKLGNNTMVYVTHDQIEALTLADRIAVMRGGVIQQLDDPATIYNKPCNLFVAGFIGSPMMSFLEGTVAEGAGGPTFRIGEVEVPLAGYDGALPKPGRDVILGVRPEHVTILPDGVDGLPATIEIEEPMGSDSLVWTSLGGQPLSIRVSSDKVPARGTPVRLAVDVSKSSLFDTSSEMRF
ncbi:sn-glycerol-3-phosphate ABC transporter ATP-binding protein UgpC [Sulfitobacter sp. D35]|uniref:ABC transporter ATP-binding protein n=1 Tax=Sulfitobacter sp. D35 TaxID=3083252 RepID=UPI00296F5C02|nr:sn-glycerol-3-phosphate ABC transporter ATP-binding protein UgpC [Sulfitobacter sp. D35]MDW4496440.1 sn-glycerol-3-phosphate ABC transporter ATP-binding protein UgpC [Sulfitobacter sp. D35]